MVALSQSGETADTLGAVKAARAKGAPILAITNVVGSALAREATGVLYMHAGPEIGVASTKTFSTMIVACYLLGLWLGRQRGALHAGGRPQAHPGPGRDPAARREDARARRAQWPSWRASSRAARDFLFLGRGIQYPIALEGALKLKEISYIHAEGYAARRDEARAHRADRRTDCRWSRSPRATAPTTA